MSPRKRKGTWSYYAGKRAGAHRPSSRVRVYERPDIPGRLFMCRRWMNTEAHRPEEIALPPHIDREKARLLAEQTALEREADIIAGRQLEAKGDQVTLGQLLEKYHDSAIASRWSKRHAKEQRRNKRFWLDELGSHVPVTGLTASRVEKIARQAAGRLGWSSRTEEKYLKYIRAATRFGYRKARLYAEDPLLNLELPEVEFDTTDRFYSVDEAKKLLESHDDVDFRVTVAANIAADTGRRISSIRHIRKDEMTIGADGRLWIRFRAEHDKRGRGAQAPVSAACALVIASALEHPLVQGSEWLLPGGHADWKKPLDQPIGASAIIRLLHKAEKACGVPRVKYRGFHGIKRLHVTLGMEESGGDTELVGDVTGNVSADLLRRVYRRQSKDRMTRQVDAVRGRIQG